MRQCGEYRVLGLVPHEKSKGRRRMVNAAADQTGQGRASELGVRNSSAIIDYDKRERGYVSGKMPDGCSSSNKPKEHPR